MVQARSRQRSTTAASAPRTNRHLNVGRCEVTIEPETGATGFAVAARQRPPAHACDGGHVVPHVPQFALLFRRFTQCPPHCVVPIGQVQRPAVHTRALKPGMPMHDAPQAPQLASSRCRLTQVPLHQTCGGAQRSTQLPPSQRRSSLHRLPQRPHWLLSLRVSTQAPSHRTLGAVQLTSQRPATQVVPAAQTVLHAPQWLRLFCGSTQLDLVLLASLHQRRLGSQRGVQTPPMQRSAGAQRLPHAPQF